MGAEPNYTPIRPTDLRKLQQRLTWDAETWSWLIQITANPSTSQLKLNFAGGRQLRWRPAAVVLELLPTGLVFAAPSKNNRGTALSWLIEDMRKRVPAVTRRIKAYQERRLDRHSADGHVLDVQARHPDGTRLTDAEILAAFDRLLTTES